MKFFYTLIAIVLFTGFLSAQSVSKNQLNTFKQPFMINDTELNKEFPGISKKNFAPFDHFKYNYAALWHDSLFPDDYGAGLRADFLFPDTNIRLQYISGWVGPQIHSIAVVLDPTAPIFKTSALKKGDNYKVDSIVFPIAYFRKLKNTEADTLIFEVVTGYVAPVYALTGPDIEKNYGVSSLEYIDLLFDAPSLNIHKPYLNYVYDSLKIKRPVYHRYKYLLTQKDTSYISPTLKLTDIVIPTPDILPNNGNVAINIYFKPGYDYIVKDDLRKMNYVQFFSRAQKGVFEYPIYNAEDWNCSYIIHTWFMDPNPNVSMGLYEYFVAPWLFGRPWYYDNHMLDIYLTDRSDIGISDNNDNSLKLSQNVPNPAANSTFINYELKSDKNVSFKVSDITGREIISINKGKQIAGKHSITLNTANLANGIYYYTLFADDTKLTRKMVIEK